MEPITLDLIKRALLKRFWAIAIFAGVAVLGVSFVAYVLPPSYSAGAKILVESQQIPTELAQSTVTASTNERLELIQQRLMTRENLTRLIEQVGLFQGRDDMTLSEMVEQVRDSISFTKIAIDRRRARDSQVAAFVLSYRSDEARIAAEMANEMTTIVLEQNLAARSRRASQTLEFFNNETSRLQEELIRAQSRLAEFKQANALALPQGLEYRQKELADLRGRRFELERQILDQERRLRDLTQRLRSGQYGPGYAEGASPQQSALSRLEQDLTQASAIYSPSHPTIRRLRTQIAQLEGAIAADASDRSDADLESLRAQARADLVAEIELVESEITLARDELEGLSERRVELEEAIEDSPQVGLRVDTLEREVQTLQSQYQAAVAKRAAAETGQKLEVNQQAERFEVIEPAQVPDEPDSPDRSRIIMLGSGAAVVVAIGLAILIEMLNRAIYTPADLERRLELRPMMSIPYIRTEQDIRGRRRRIGLIVLIGTAIPLLGLWAIDQYYMPLDLVFDKVLERSGLDRLIGSVTSRF